MKKKVTIFLSIALSVIVVLAGTFQFYVKPRYLSPLVTAVEELLLEDEETVDLLLEEYASDLTEEEKTEKSKLEEEKDEDDDEKEKIVATNKDEIESTENLKSESESNKGKEVIVGGKSIEELQKQVEPADLKAGLNLASKIDVGYLLGVYKNGGLSSENKKAVKSHLNNQLTSTEFSQLKGFVGKYAHLLK